MLSKINELQGYLSLNFILSLSWLYGCTFSGDAVEVQGSGLAEVQASGDSMASLCWAEEMIADVSVAISAQSVKLARAPTSHLLSPQIC